VSARATGLALAVGGAGLAAAVVLMGAREVSDGQLRADGPALPLVRGRSIEQTFRAPVDGLVAVEVQLATYGRTADGTLEVGLARDDGRAVGSWSVPAETVVDNAWRRFELPRPAAGVAGRALRLSLRRPEAGGRPLTAWTSPADAYPDGAMTPGPGDLAFRAAYRPPFRQGVAHLLRSTGRPPLVAAVLLAGLFASALAFPYTFALHLARDAGGDPA
jgi:hypothetical protein